MVVSILVCFRLPHLGIALEPVHYVLLYQSLPAKNCPATGGDPGHGQGSACCAAAVAADDQPFKLQAYERQGLTYAPALAAC